MVESTEIATYVDLVGLDGSELPTLLYLSHYFVLSIIFEEDSEVQ